MNKNLFTLLLSVLFCLHNAAGQSELKSTSEKSFQPTWSSLDQRPVPGWFTDARFGIFIHWGIYSVPAWAPANEDISIYAKYAEWYWRRINSDPDPNTQKTDVNKFFRDYHEKTWGKNFRYQDFAPLWKAQHFDPDAWAELFKRSGAKYVVMTSKHHEGFTLWPSEQSWNWNSVDIGPHRDLCEEFATAIKKAGLHLGFYYSLYEWFNPLYHSNPASYVNDHMLPQMKDLVTRYEPELIYADGEWDHPSSLWRSEEFLAWLYNESVVKNTVVVNDRWGKETRSKHGGFYTTEYGLVHADSMSDELTAHPWEEIRGIGTSFGYNRIETLDHYLSSEALVHMLIQTVSKGGNLCLNVGPTDDGRIPVIMQERLLDIGQWLDVCGEAIYGTSSWSGRPSSNDKPGVYFTLKDGNLYILCTRWPSSPIVVNGISKSGKVSLLGSPATVKSKQSGNSLTIQPPLIPFSGMPCNYAWVFKVTGAGL